MALTKKQIKEFKAEKECEELEYKSQSYRGVADEIAEAGDKKWTKELYEKASKGASGQSIYLGVGVAVIDPSKSKFLDNIKNSAEPVNVSPPFENKIKDWVKYILKLKEINVNEENLDKMIELYGDSVASVVNEIEKISLMQGGAKQLDLKKYLSETGRILPSRVTSVSLKKQRELSKSIKRARLLALL